MTGGTGPAVLWHLRGAVGGGRQMGRKLGTPTANIALGKTTPPPAGVYAGRARWAGQDWRPMVVNVGTRPTFDGQEQAVEVHVLDFEGDLYGKDLEVEALTKLRSERRFADVEALKKQIKQDITHARSLMQEEYSPWLSPKRKSRS